MRFWCNLLCFLNNEPLFKRIADFSFHHYSVPKQNAPLNFQHLPDKAYAHQQTCIPDILTCCYVTYMVERTWHVSNYLQYPSNVHLCNHFCSEEESNNKVTAECYILQEWVLLKCLGCVQTDGQQAH